MSNYQPDREEHTITGPDGQPLTITSESYGRAHAERQADAEAALMSIQRAKSAVVLKVLCTAHKPHTLARVYRTPIGYVVELRQDTKANADMRRVRRETGMDLSYVGGTMADPLAGSYDRDLEASCKCGAHLLDRDVLRVAIDMGRDTLNV